MSKAFRKMFVPALVFSLVFLSAGSAAQAEENADAIYLYHALENHASPDQMLNMEEAVPEEPREEVDEALKQKLREEDTSKALRQLTLKQESVLMEAEKTIHAVENKSELRTTVLGNNLGTLEFQLVQIKGIEAQLNSLTSKTVDVGVKTQIKDQIETLKDTQRKIEGVMEEKKDGFSLLGWLVATL